MPLTEADSNALLVGARKASSPAEAALAEYGRLLRRFLEGDADIALEDARRALAEDSTISDAFDEHWRTVERISSDAVVRKGREAQSELAAAFEDLMISQRRSSERVAEAFAEKGRQLEALLECIPAMAFIKNDLLRYVFVDESYAKLFGRGSSQVVSLSDSDLFSPSTAERFEELDRRALDSGHVVESRDPLTTSKGTVWARAFRSPVCNANGRPASLLGLLFLEEPPSSAAVGCGREIAQVAHELRTPLTAIRDSIALIEDESAGPLNAHQREFVTIAARNCGRLERLLEDTIQLERLADASAAFVIESADLGALAEKACLLAQSWTGNSTVEYAPPAVPLRANVDVVLATRMVANLVVWAIRVSPSRTARVKLRQDDDQVEVIVSCDGSVGSLIELETPIGIAQTFVGRVAKAHGAVLGVRLSGPLKGAYIGLRSLADEDNRGGKTTVEAQNSTGR